MKEKLSKEAKAIQIQIKYIEDAAMIEIRKTIRTVAISAYLSGVREILRINNKKVKNVKT